MNPILFAIVVLSTLSPGFAAAQVAPDAAVLLAEARAKSGAEAWRGIAVLQASGTVRESGLDGRFTTTVDVRDGRSDERETFDVFAIRDLWDGHAGWHQDNSGGVHRYDGAYSRRKFADDAWLTRRDWLKPGAGGAWIGPVARADGVDTVTVVPPGGEAMDLSFDTATRDLVRVVRTRPTTTETFTFGAWRDVDGVRLPFTIDVVASDGDASHAQVNRYTRLAKAPDDAFAQPVAPDDTRIGATPVTVPLELRNGVLTIEARLNGKGPFRFIFDTGGHSIVSPQVAEALGLTLAGAGQSGGAGEGTLVERYTRIERVDIGGVDQRGFEADGVTLSAQHFYVLDLGYSTFERGRREPIAGLLGLELLERLATRIDYRGAKMTFTAFERHRFDPAATVVPLTFDNDIPLVTAALGGRPGVFALDTGNSGSTLVQHRWAERVGLAERMKAGLESASVGAGGVSRNWASRLDPVDIGGARIEGQHGRYAEDQRGSFASRTEAGNLGSDILANFTLDFDYRRGLMGWQYVPGYRQPPFSRAGVRMQKRAADDVRVLAVADGSPAAAAGLRAADRIASVDGVPVVELSGADIADAFRQAPGAVVRVSAIRDGRTFDATIVLKELLP